MIDDERVAKAIYDTMPVGVREWADAPEYTRLRCLTCARAAIQAGVGAARTPFEMITEFHRVYGQAAPAGAMHLPAEVQRLRFDLIAEEFREYREAAEHGDLGAIAKELADLVYVVIGTAVAHGLTRFDEIFAEVHRSNMSKLGADGRPVLRQDGKILKGPAYTPPDIARLLGAVPRGT